MAATAVDAALQQPRGAARGGGRPAARPPAAGELARLLAHDLRTPLNGLRGFTELLVTGAAGPLPTPALELLAEVARAGRALEAVAELAQEAAEARAPARGGGGGVADLGALLERCGFRLDTRFPSGSGVAVRGRTAGWARLLAVCRAHLAGEAAATTAGGAPPWASLADPGGGRLELTLGRTDLESGWQMSVLREYLLRRLAAAQDAVLASEAPHLPLLLLLRRRDGPASPGGGPGSFFP